MLSLTIDLSRFFFIFKLPFKRFFDLHLQSRVLILTVFINRCGVLIIPFLTPYLIQSLGYTINQATIAVTSYGIASVITGAVSGQFYSRFRPDLILLFSLFTSSIVLVGLYFFNSLTAIIILLVLFSFSTELFRPTALATIAIQESKENRKRAFAFLRVAMNLGIGFGSFIGSNLIHFTSYKVLLLLGSLTSATAGIFLRLRSNQAPIVVEKQNRQPCYKLLKYSTVLFSQWNLCIFYLGMFLCLAAFSQNTTTLPIYLIQEMHLSENFYGTLLALSSLLVVLLEVPMSVLTLRWSPCFALVLGTILAAIGFGSFGRFYSPSMLMISTIIFTVGEILIFPAASTYISECSRDEDIGSAMGFYSMTINLAFLLGPLAGIHLFSSYKGSIFWAIVSMLCYISAILFVLTGIFENLTIRYRKLTSHE